MGINIFDYIDSNTSGIDEFAFIINALHSGVSLENFHIQKIAATIIRILTFSKKENTEIQILFKEFLNSDFYCLFESHSSEFLNCLKSGLGQSPEASMNTLTLIAKIQDIGADEFVELLVESANQFPQNEEFFCFVIRAFDAVQNDISEQSFVQFVLNMLKIIDGLSYHAEVSLARTIAQSQFVLPKKSVINYLSKFIVDEEIGNVCVKKMGEILEYLKQNNKQKKIQFLCKVTEEDLESISLGSSHSDALDAFALMSNFPAYIAC